MSIKLAYKNIVILTGAGISAESGLKTFRDNDGLWEGHKVEDVATPQAFERNPTLVQNFYNQRRLQLNSGQVHPNEAHLALARLEESCSSKLTIITQNVDDLHERAKSKNILHMHGELNKIRCISSNISYSWTGELSANEKCECCAKENTLRPDIVWFGEMPYHLREIEELIISCDLFISIGTSGHVYPAAGLVEIANTYQAKTVELNLDKTENSNSFDVSIKGKASQSVNDMVDFLLSGNKY